MDQAGNLRGTTRGVTGAGAFSLGTVFELSPDQDGKWKETSLFQFSGGNNGTLPLDGFAIDSAGNLYGTTFEGGNGAGLIFELTPQKKGPPLETVIYEFQPCGDETRQENARRQFLASAVAERSSN
jgi:uncharacterized repeat protein (TIGR03803 family)